MSLNSYIAKQFADPKGLGGHIISTVMNRQNRPLYDETQQLLFLCDTDSVLDIGCGNGFVMDMMAQQHGAVFTGSDPSDEIIQVAKRRNRKYVESQRMYFYCQGASSLSFPEASFTKAYSINTVYFWGSLDEPMREIRRVLKPGGIFINALYTDETLARFSHTQFGYRRYDARQLTKAGMDVGFTVETVSIAQGAAICYMYHKNK